MEGQVALMTLGISVAHSQEEPAPGYVGCDQLMHGGRPAGGPTPRRWDTATRA
jgi:hypothetical protein